MSKQVVSTTAAPAAIGTYSQAVISGRNIWISGQIPLDPATGLLVEGDIDAQIRQVFENLKAIAQAAGASLAHAVKLNVYLTDLGNFAKVNQIMSEYVPQPYPARAAVQVSALPRGCAVEIDGVLELP